MKTIYSLSELKAYGLDCLTGEACGLGMRLLFDVTEQGKKTLCKMFGCSDIRLAQSWNGKEAVGSIMMTREMAITVGIFALLDSGCLEVWTTSDDGTLYGLETFEEIGKAIETNIGMPKDCYWRRWKYAGTAQDRNVHVMSGRIT